MSKFTRTLKRFVCFLLQRHTPAYLREHAESFHQIYRNSIPCLVCACGHCGKVILVPAYKDSRKGAL